MLNHSNRLLRLVFRRERVTSSVWIAILLLFALTLPAALSTMYSDETALAGIMEMLQNPAMAAMMGPVYGSTLGALYVVMMLLWTIIAVAAMNIFLVVRHTRSDEERGRVEVVRSLPVGRLSNLHAVMLAALVENAVIGLLTGLVMAAQGIESMDVAGCMLFGAAVGVSGLFFAALTAVFVQLCSNSRGAVGFPFALLGVFYLLRAMGDTGNEALSLVSPLGLVMRTQAFAGNHWLPCGILLLEAVVLAAAAYILNALRDLDQGFIPARLGRRDAKPSLLSPFGLMLRLLRNTMIAWLITVLAVALAYGSVLGDIDEFIAGNAIYQQMLPQTPGYSSAQLFITMINAISALICVIPVLLAVLKLRSEEREGRAEHLLVRSVSRTKMLACYVSAAFAASVLMPLASAVGLYAASVAAMEVPFTWSSVLESSMVYLPALWLMLGFAVLLLGLLPKRTALCWAYMGYAFFIILFGGLFEADYPTLVLWAKRLTPFGYIPQLPVDSVNFAVLAGLTLVAAVLTAAGFVFYRRRDVSM